MERARQSKRVQFLRLQLILLHHQTAFTRPISDSPKASRWLSAPRPRVGGARNDARASIENGQHQQDHLRECHQRVNERPQRDQQAERMSIERLISLPLQKRQVLTIRNPISAYQRQPRKRHPPDRQRLAVERNAPPRRACPPKPDSACPQKTFALAVLDSALPEYG